MAGILFGSDNLSFVGDYDQSMQGSYDESLKISLNYVKYF